MCWKYGKYRYFELFQYLSLSALVFVLAGWHPGERLVVRASEDVVANHVVPLETLGPGGVSVVELRVRVLDVPVGDPGEVVAPHPRAGGDGGAPGAVGLAQQHRKARPLVTRVTLVPASNVDFAILLNKKNA